MLSSPTDKTAAKDLGVSHWCPNCQRDVPLYLWVYIPPIHAFQHRGCDLILLVKEEEGLSQDG